MGENPIQPQEWDRSCRAAQVAVRSALAEAAIRRNVEDRSGYAALAVGIGGITASGEILRAVTAGSQYVLETMAIAYLRGALRGLDEPVNADGTPYEGATHA